MAGSEANRTDNGTGLQPSEQKLCTSSCGFFGSNSTMDLCSKCYRDLKHNKAQAASAQAAVDNLFDEPSASSSSLTVGLPGADVAELVAPTPASGASHCLSCRKKVGLLGFKCRCGSTFCGVHRYPEKHQCSVDFKALGRDAIAKANPVVKTDKIQRIK